MVVTAKSNREQPLARHDEVAELKHRVELSELRALDVEMQARYLEAKVRLGEAQARLKSQRLQTERSE
jgi:hypothetical protein